MVEICSVCVRMSILCVLNVNQYCTYLVAFVVSFIHPTLSEYQYQISTFVLMSTFIIQSGVNSGTSNLVTSVSACSGHCYCEYELECKRYTFHSFLALNSTHVISEAPN
jgi:hypothetical protein